MEKSETGVKVSKVGALGGLHRSWNLHEKHQNCGDGDENYPRQVAIRCQGRKQLGQLEKESDSRVVSEWGEE